MTAHAKLRPPSAAARWLSCSASVTVVPQYPNEESDKSLKGTFAHNMLENALLFGIPPNGPDPDQNEHIRLLLDYVAERRREYGPQCQVFAEQTYTIPEADTFGTADVTFVAPKIIEIADYKDGYVVVDVTRNPQLMNYLLGAIAKYGPRDRYRITIAQPNYNHVDGPIRSFDVTEEDLRYFRGEVKWAMTNNEFVAGKHCKKTYCPHRGACATFLKWAETNGADAWFTSEVNAMTDEQLSEALDHADILQGIRDELRKEAMRRILNMDRKIPGHKIVKGKTDRGFADEEKVRQVAIERFGASEDDLYKKTFTTVKGIEDFVKKACEPLGRGKWKEVWRDEFAPHIREFTGGLTLERASDGRPAHKRGSEFGPIAGPESAVSGNERIAII